MTELGFTDVHNAGGLEDVADVVGPVVTERLIRQSRSGWSPTVRACGRPGSASAGST